MKAAVLIFVILLVSCTKKTTSVEYSKPIPINDEIVMEYDKEPEPTKEVKRDPKTVIIYFEFDSYEIPNEEMEKIYSIDNGAKLTGGTCDIGPYDYNYDLGLKRAYSVKNELEKNGIHVLNCISVGESEPISDKKEYNRRCKIEY